MATLCVVGPVIGRFPFITRPPFMDTADQYARTYRFIDRYCGERNIKVQFPLSEPRLEESNPQEFYSQMESRIEGANIVLTVCSGENLSEPIEAAMASFKQKEQFIAYRDGMFVPRLLRGLPNVIKTVPLSELPDIMPDIAGRLSEIDGLTL